MPEAMPLEHAAGGLPYRRSRTFQRRHMGAAYPRPGACGGWNGLLEYMPLCVPHDSHGNDADIGIAGIGQRIPYPRRNGYKGMGGTGTADISFDTPRHVAERAVAGLSHKQRRIPGNMRDICVFTY